MAGSPAAPIDPRNSHRRAVRNPLRPSLVLAFAARDHFGFGLPRSAAPAATGHSGHSLLLLASLSWIGHAAMEEGPARVAHEFNQTVHLLAAGLWLGGLLPLGWLLRRARAPQDVASIALIRDAIRHFSQMGYVAVAFIALTGAINSLLLVGSLGAMFGTPYGRLLALKNPALFSDGYSGAD